MILHIDKHFYFFIEQYGNWIYLFLFMIVFVETGFVLIPFLPGDSLLFIGGAFAAQGLIDPWLLISLLFMAATMGNTLNYFTGSYIGTKVYEKNFRFLDRETLHKTRTFYECHGGKTIVIARFVPVIRTFAAFVAGVSKMHWQRFQFYNIVGAGIWVVSLVGGGYLFGNLPIVKQYLNVIVLVGLGAAVVPLAIGALWNACQAGK